MDIPGVRQRGANQGGAVGGAVVGAAAAAQAFAAGAPPGGGAPRLQVDLLQIEQRHQHDVEAALEAGGLEVDGFAVKPAEVMAEVSKVVHLLVSRHRDPAAFWTATWGSKAVSPASLDVQKETWNTFSIWHAHVTGDRLNRLPPLQADLVWSHVVVAVYRHQTGVDISPILLPPLPGCAPATLVASVNKMLKRVVGPQPTEVVTDDDAVAEEEEVQYQIDWSL
jgi:hypothetical protein